MVPIFKGKGDAMSCSAYRGVKLLEHAMKIVKDRSGEGVQDCWIGEKGCHESSEM